MGVKSSWDIRSMDSLPKKPWKLPERPAEYTQFKYKANPTQTNEVGITDHHGGWGYRTMGLVEPTGFHFKTFGVHGTGKGVNPLTLEEGNIAFAKQSHHYNAPTGADKTYITVSIWPNAWDAAP